VLDTLDKIQTQLVCKKRKGNLFRFLRVASCLKLCSGS